MRYFWVGFQVSFPMCSFHSFILSCWFAALSFALAVFFLLLTSFIVCQAILDCLSSTESLILSIWFWMYSVCSFIYMPANWYCAVFSFKALSSYRSNIQGIYHHHVAPPARISLTVSRHFSLSFIASGRSSGLQPVSSHSCCM